MREIPRRPRCVALAIGIGIGITLTPIARALAEETSAAPTSQATPAMPPPPPPTEREHALLHEVEAERQSRLLLEDRVVQLEKEADEKRRQPLPVTVSGFVHMDWVLFRQSSQNEVTQDGQPLNEDRFVLRRARLKVERDHGLFHGVFEIDANTTAGPQLRPINAEASLKWPAYRPYARTPWALDEAGLTPPSSLSSSSASPSPKYSGPWFMVTVGLFRTPFGFEVPEAERERPFLERSAMSNALFPQSFDLGLRVVGGFRFVRWAFAVMNGDPIGERTFPGRDPNESKDLVFRVGGASALTDEIRVEGGFSGVSGRGFHRGQPASKDVIQWQDSNADGVIDSTTELQVIPGSPATPSQSFKRFAVGADLRANIRLPVIGDLHMRGEIVRGSNLDRGQLISDPIVATRDLRQIGWYLGVAQEVTRWALVGVRYDRYDPDSDAREQEPFALVPRDLAASTWSFNLTLRAWVGSGGSEPTRANERRAWLVRLTGQYDHRENTLGRDVSGRPTTLKDDSFTLRAEARF